MHAHKQDLNSQMYNKIYTHTYTQMHAHKTRSQLLEVQQDLHTHTNIHACTQTRSQLSEGPQDFTQKRER